MDEIARLYVGTVGATQGTLFDYTNGAIVKGIMISNTGKTDKTLKLTVDGIDFLFPVKATDTVILDNPLACNRLQANVIAQVTTTDTSSTTETETQELNISVTGLKLGVA